MDDSEDRALEAFRKGQLAFVGVSKELERLRADRLLRRGGRVSQYVADDTAQTMAKALQRYLANCPAEERHSLAGEIFRGILFEWMGPDITDWDLERLDPMPPDDD
jgi:hypothetical protein